MGSLDSRARERGGAFANHEVQVAKVLLDHWRGMRAGCQHNRGLRSRNDDCAKGKAPELLPFEGHDPFRGRAGRDYKRTASDMPN
ncbi:hypothetical protein CBM2615_A260060 [Cupriavidus taiwanensis]|nr:hypothetical protein CBM2615_A260060 [Cupriavidus taiwanensis]